MYPYGIRAKDLSGKIICCGMGSIVAFQELSEYLRSHRNGAEYRNASSFVSYGLTSLVSLYIGMGLVLNV